MRLSEAARKDSGVYPEDGAIGRERSTWYSVTQLHVFSRGLDVADLGAFPGDSLKFRVPNGIYAVEARLIDFDGSLCVSRVRTRLAHTNGKLGRKRGNLSVDYSAIAIADYQSIQDKLDNHEQRELNQQAIGFMNVGFCRKCAAKVRRRTIHFVVSRSGEGDGTYPVFPLRCRGHCVGFEIEFFRNGHVLPPRPIPDVEWRKLR